MGTAEDAQAKALVLALLQDPVFANVAFTLGKWTIKLGFYTDVANAIRDDKITIIVDQVSAANGLAAAYFPTFPLPNDKEMYDVLALRITNLGSSTSEQFRNAGVIIHECTHAGLDLLGWTPMTHLEHEALAYIAEARALWLKMESLRGDPKKVTFTDDPIHQAAWYCAEDLATDGTIGKVHTVLLAGAIGFNTQYNGKALKLVANDGVGKPWRI